MKNSYVVVNIIRIRKAIFYKIVFMRIGEVDLLFKTIKLLRIEARLMKYNMYIQVVAILYYIWIMKQGNEKIVDMYEQMFLLRNYEDKIYFLFLEGVMPGTIHQSQGLEASAVGMLYDLR